MDNNDNEIKFKKDRSNSIGEVVENFKKSNYYDAFYLYNRLEKEERLALVPMVVEAYSRLKKSDYEAKALFEMLVQSDELKNVSAVDRKIVTMRLSEYYNTNGEKLGRVRVIPEEQERDFDTAQKRNVIMFESLSTKSTDCCGEDCEIYSKNSLQVDKGDYLLERATSLAMAKRYDDAIKVLQKIGERSVRYNDAQKLRVAILIDCGKFDEVVDVAIDVLRHNPNEFIGIFALNICISMGKDKDKIFEFLRGLVNAKGLQINVLRARAFAEVEQLEKGVEILNSLDVPDKFSHEALTLKAILYDGLEDKQKEEETLKEILTIYPYEIEPRFLLTRLIAKDRHVSSRVLGSKYLVDLIQEDLSSFINSKLEKFEDLTIEEAEYYWNASMKYGDANVISQVALAYYKSKSFKNIALASLVDINLDDTKKLMVIENLVFEGCNENSFLLINGRVKKIDFGEARENLNNILNRESVKRIEVKGVDIVQSVVRGYSKFVAISTIMEIPMGGGAKSFEKYLDEMANLEGEALMILTAPHNIALCSSIMENPNTLKNQKVKRYLSLKKTDRDILLDLLKKEGIIV